MNIFIVDDEHKSRELIKLVLKSILPDSCICGEAGSVPEAVKGIQEAEPDLLLLDVELETGTGFDVLARLKDISFPVIFITAHSHYAIQAIKFSAVDYLLKPLDPGDLADALDRVREMQQDAGYKKKLDNLLQNINPASAGQQKIALPTSDGLIFAPLKDIIYCKAEGAYTTFYMENEKILVSRNLKEYELMLETQGFFRVHNSYLVNLSKIKRYVKGDGGYLILANGTTIDVSKRRKESFLAVISRM
ncbi:MAG: response regulator transcription factor [Chitinophagaceae bacterium]|nr:response regulator transcription factor [Chitinophagaceae bacterium]